MLYTVENTAAIGRRVRVFVDGKELQRCIMADTDKGVAEYHRIDPRTGKCQLNRKRDQFVVRRRYGKVTVAPYA